MKESVNEHIDITFSSFCLFILINGSINKWQPFWPISKFTAIFFHRIFILFPWFYCIHHNLPWVAMLLNMVCHTSLCFPRFIISHCLHYGETHLEAEWVGVVAGPGMAAVQHVQHHAAAAPHVSLGAAPLAKHHLGGHVCLSTLQPGPCTNTQHNTLKPWRRGFG